MTEGELHGGLINGPLVGLPPRARLAYTIGSVGLHSGLIGFVFFSKFIFRDGQTTRLYKL
jgi:hypothetical protein